MIEKIGLFTEIDNVSPFVDMFKQEGFDCKFDLCTETLPNWTSQLRFWDSTGFDIAIIDDNSFSDKEAIIKGIENFMNQTRAQDGHLRIIFFPDAGREPDDDVFVRLAHVGVYDFFLPKSIEEDVNTLFNLVRKPNRRDEVISYIVAKGHESETKFYGIKGRETVAVASLYPKAGVTTTAIVLARTILLAYKNRGLTGKQMPSVALGVSEEFFKALSMGYANSFDPKKGVYRLEGLLIFNTMSASRMPQCDYVVLDLGQLDLNKTMGELAGDERYRSFLSAGTKVVCVPYTNFVDLIQANEMFRQLSPEDLTAYKLAFWGIKDEYLQMIKKNIAQKAVGNYSWKMPYCPWPYDLDKIDPSTIYALKDILPKGYWKPKEEKEQDKSASKQSKGIMSRLSLGGRDER